MVRYSYFKYLCLLLLILGCRGSVEEGSTVPKKAPFSRPFVTMENLFGVEAYGRDNAWVVGFEGTILHTTDGGLNWETQKGPENVDLYDASFVDAQRGWSVGKFGTILHTTDGGKNWIKQESGTKERLFDVCFIDTHRGWVVGTMGTILHTKDGGKSWVNQGIGEDRYYNSVFFIDAKRGWIVGEYNFIYHTEDGGEEWVRQECEELIPEEPEDDFPPPPPHLYGVYFSDTETGWATGMDGIIIKTEDGGKTWKRLKTDAEFTLFKVAVIGNKGWAIGERGQYLISDDRGNRWEKQMDVIRTRFWMRDMVFTDAQHGWIVGAFGTILHTEDGGSNWKMISGIFIQ